MRGHLRNSHERKAIDEINAQRAHYEAHPELYCTTEEFAEAIKPLEEKFNMSRAKKHEIDTTPVMLACPHCEKELPVNVNIRFWTPQELRNYADTLEEVQRLAAVNRAASLEAQKEPLEEPIL